MGGMIALILNARTCESRQYVIGQGGHAHKPNS